jgi:septum formation topological specificity factor MinE
MRIKTSIVRVIAKVFRIKSWSVAIDLAEKNRYTSIHISIN